MTWEAIAITGFFALVLALMAGLWRMGKRERAQWRINRDIAQRRWNGDAKDSWVILLALSAALLAPWPHAAHAVDYDVVYVRAPRYGDVTPTKWPEVKDPIVMEPNTDLMLWRHTTGQSELLVAGGADGAAINPFPSFDAQWLYYSHCPNIRTLNQGGIPIQGCDIYKMHLATRAITRLTFQEWTPNTGVGTWCADPKTVNSSTCNSPGHGVFNLSPVPVAGGRVAFVSSRSGYVPNAPFTKPNMQLYILDETTGITHKIGHLNLGSALDPFPMPDGTLAFSSYEAQGRSDWRDPRLWSLWNIYPDGRQWKPLWSAFLWPFAAHFGTATTDGRIAALIYYNQNDQGFGTLLKFTPVGTAQGRPVFGSPVRTDPSNPLVAWGCHESTPTVQNQQVQFPFSPHDTFSLTPFTTGADEATGCQFNGQRAGKVTHPSAAPGNTILVAWSAGPAVLTNKPTNMPRVDSGIYLMDAVTPTANPFTDLQLIVNDPAYNEQQPRALVPWSAIHGQPEPPDLGWWPRQDARLLPGEAAGLIGTSSLCWHTADDENPGGGVNAGSQGQSIGKGRYGCDDIYAMRILAAEPTSEKVYGPGAYGLNKANWYQQAGTMHEERMHILGEIPIAKYDAMGSLLTTQQPDGLVVKDTSFLARIPCAVPFIFQSLDAHGNALNHSGTWHQVMCGEVRQDCGGCHAHEKTPLLFANTAAATASYQVPDLVSQTPLLTATGTIRYASRAEGKLEFLRDVQPILQSRGLPTTYAATEPNVIPLNSYDSTLIANLATAGATPEERLLVRRWISIGAPLDKGGYFFDEVPPALHLHQEGNTLYVGASDNYALDASSLTVTLNGQPLTLVAGDRQTWSAACVGGGRIIARVKDIQGNWTQAEKEIQP